MFGKDYESLGHDVLRSVKSTQILHFPLAFFTITTLASHLGYCISLIWPCSINFRISSVAVVSFSSLSLLRLWILALILELTFRRWQITSGSIPGMSFTIQSKDMRLERRTRHSSDSLCASRSDTILTFLGEISISFSSPTSLGPRWSSDVLGSSLSPSTSLVGVCV